MEAAPTMIIPAGTEIGVDQHGQLSIRTPGNLVIQNSGNYGTIESVQGSIRIEPNVQVEAVHVRCAKVCYVQGSLTAWKVEAESVQLEEEARAHIVLQETSRLQIGRHARLVGNFSSEKELFLLFSRFAAQMKSLPFGLLRDDNRRDEPVPTRARLAPALEPFVSAPSGFRSEQPGGIEYVAPAPLPGALRPSAPERVPEELFLARVLLEREAGRNQGGPAMQRVLGELLELLRVADYESLRAQYQGLFSRVPHPTPDLSKARRQIDSFLAGQS